VDCLPQPTGLCFETHPTDPISAEPRLLLSETFILCDAVFRAVVASGVREATDHGFLLPGANYLRFLQGGIAGPRCLIPGLFSRDDRCQLKLGLFSVKAD
jgi:hypothetical protein